MAKDALPPWMERLKLLARYPLLTRLVYNRSQFRLAVLVAFAVATAAILPRQSTETFDIEVGRVWQQSEVLAPFDFPIRKDESVLKEERARALADLPAVYLEQEGTANDQRQKLSRWFSQLEEMVQQQRKADLVQRREAELVAGFNELRPGVTPEQFRLYVSRPDLLRKNASRAFQIMDTIYRAGHIDRLNEEMSCPFVSLRNKPTLERVRKEISQVFDRNRVLGFTEQRLRDLNGEEARLIQQALFYFLKPNFVYSQELNEAERRAALTSILPHYGVVKQGAVIIRPGEQVTQEHARKLRSLSHEQMQHLGNSPQAQALRFLGQLVLVALLVTMVAFFLRLNRRRIYYRRRGFLLLFTIYFLILLLVTAVQNIALQMVPTHELNLVFMVPLCMAPLMITVFFDDRVAYFSNTIISIFAALICQSSFEVFFIQMVAGSMVVFNLTRLKRRAQFFQTAGIALATYMAAFLAYQLYQKGDLTEIPYENLVLFAINVAFTLGTYPLIYFIEKIFGLTSDLTFMELLDTDHALLKELARKAPGTYQHSLQVANIAEEVAKRVGANPVLVHVGALFHDIGKMGRPDYFTENQKTEVSPHEGLSPMESAAIIIEHVTKGAEMARERGLPEEIVEFILSHHGTSRVEFFYRKFCEMPLPQKPEDEKQFRYPGPLPSSKEMAIVMMADSVEAAARCLDNPSSEDIARLVENIIAAKISDHQLDEAQLTFHDLSIIKRELVSLLQSIHHTRVKYPEAAPSRPMVV